MVEDYDTEGCRDGFKKGRHKGIKEVIDWLMQENDKNPQILDGSFIIAKLNSERWQAKLKEWGIDTSPKV